MSDAKKFEELTEEQLAQTGPWAQKWIEIGLNTEPADFDKAEEAVLKCYDLIEQERPKAVLRVSSPWAAIYEGSKKAMEIKTNGNYTDDDLWSYIKTNWSNYRGAQLWVSWHAYITFLRDVVGWNDPVLENFALDEAIATSCGFVWWAEECAAISDRPVRVARDAAGRLHHETEKALEYRDGWGLYSWHGYRIPETHEWIIAEKSKITPDKIEHETNAELRRIMLEIFGFENYVKAREAKVISEDVLHGQPRRLLEFEVANEKVRAVEVVNGTKEPDGTYRKFILGCVRQDGRYPDTPAEAIAWSYGINPSKYKESVRT